MKFVKKAPPSEARRLLAEVNSARVDVETAMAAIRASLSRLAEIQAAPAEAEADLARLDSAEAGAMAEWSRKAEGAPPVADGDRRSTILRALNAARSAAAAARTAEAALNSEYAIEHGKLAGIEAHADAAIASLLLEEAMPAVDALLEATKAHALAFESMTAVATMAGDLARKVGVDFARPAFVALEAFHAKLAAAVARPVPNHNAAAAPWRKLVADLAADSGAQVEG